eukprot:COSAG06_NODE_2439_length_6872_cov_162.242876_2_plen_178_part_00
MRTNTTTHRDQAWEPGRAAAVAAAGILAVGHTVGTAGGGAAAVGSHPAAAPAAGAGLAADRAIRRRRRRRHRRRPLGQRPPPSSARRPISSSGSYLAVSLGLAWPPSGRRSSDSRAPPPPGSFPRTLRSSAESKPESKRDRAFSRAAQLGKTTNRRRPGQFIQSHVELKPSPFALSK